MTGLPGWQPAPNMCTVSLAGKVALVTGGARRVGRAIVEELARRGANMVVHYHRSQAEADKLLAVHPDAFLFRADLRSAEGGQQLIEAIGRRFGRLDYLVNSAADYPRGAFVEQDDATWLATIELNLLAPARLSRLALGLGVTSIVNIADVAAWQPWRRHAAYAASKAALVQLTRCLALELAPAVRVNAVAPGTVAFPDDFDETARHAILRGIPLGHVGTPEDVARAVRFLLEEDFVTGSVLTIDGGAALR